MHLIALLNHKNDTFIYLAILNRYNYIENIWKKILKNKIVGQSYNVEASRF